jgi:hypothetical protein
MAQRSVGEVMAEGQKLTLELLELKRKEIAGTATAEEKIRITQLDAYLLGLVGEAQAMGVGVGVGTGYGQTQNESAEDGDEDLDFGDEDESDDWGLESEDEPENERQQNYGDNNPFGYPRY